jgi:hypothetical protein
MSYMELIVTIGIGLVTADIVLDLWLAYNLLQYRKERAAPLRYGVHRGP